MAVKLMTPIILEPDALLDLRDIGPNIDLLEKEIARAERAGIDMKDAKARLSEAKRQREGLLKEYG